MPFPDAERVVYDRNPLVQVICQLRFPSILRIDAEVPVAFQEAVRRSYPICRAGEELQAQVEFPEEIRKLIGSNLPFRTAKTAPTFFSDDEHWQINLTRDWLSLTSHKYERWETFKERLQAPLRALREIYSPPHFTRIGLRYQDLIRRSELGLDDAPWSELLQPHAAGELASPHVAGDVEHMVRELVLRLDDTQGGRLRVRHGLAQRSDSPETCYLIDSDFYTEQRTEIEHAVATLDVFNRNAGRLFRWCITAHLHNALGPHALGVSQ